MIYDAVEGSLYDFTGRFLSSSDLLKEVEGGLALQLSDGKIFQQTERNSIVLLQML